MGRSFLRQILAETLGCRPQDVPIEYDGAGKPQLPSGSGWHFNLSHSEEWALIGLTQLGPIGVDIEKVRDGFAVEPIAQRFFSPPEVADLLTLPAEQRLLAFFRCWTRKEAFIKAIGLGLAYPLDEFDVTLLPGDPPAIRSVKGDPAAGAGWGMYEVPSPPGFVGALVTPTPHARLVVFDHEDI
ncbi:MAG: 4'-phosphopantetheinyl transferase superfamily protein [Gemmataceae bacterium]|nr:4'-phosphopantetheinyl transferase superfamily protein [Gemmataceae bacterium]